MNAPTEGAHMIVAVFEGTDMTETQYQRIIAELAAVGAGAPDGRIDHIASWDGGKFCVVDTWEDTDKLNHFAETLFPIMDRIGITPPAPHIFELRNTIHGA
jgi:hypothetical protein